MVVAVVVSRNPIRLADCVTLPRYFSVHDAVACLLVLVLLVLLLLLLVLVLVLVLLLLVVVVGLLLLLLLLLLLARPGNPRPRFAEVAGAYFWYRAHDRTLGGVTASVH
jgi:hypothetical protein